MFDNLTANRSTAIIEIVIMLLIAFILGFILAWILKKSKASGVVGNQDNSELDRLKDNNRSLSADKLRLEAEQENLKVKLRKCEDEKSSTPENTVQEDISSSDAENAKKLGFKAMTSDKNDDLTKISGVGPFIEKKLNGLGICTFEQISEFTPDTIEKVTKAIEFFPGRIERDNWVKQASELK